MVPIKIRTIRLPLRTVRSLIQTLRISLRTIRGRLATIHTSVRTVRFSIRTLRRRLRTVHIALGTALGATRLSLRARPTRGLDRPSLGPRHPRFPVVRWERAGVRGSVRSMSGRESR